MFKVGDKVVPISKSTPSFYCSFEECKYRKQAQEDGQNFLYIQYIYPDGDIVCNNEELADDATEDDWDGSIYLVKDLVLFESKSNSL